MMWLRLDKHNNCPHHLRDSHLNIYYKHNPDDVFVIIWAGGGGVVIGGLWLYEYGTQQFKYTVCGSIYYWQR